MKNGLISVSLGLTEMGQGLKTVMCQLVSEILKVPLSKIAISNADTSNIPAAADPGASQATYMNGNALLRALNKLRAAVIEEAAKYFEEAESRILLENGCAYVEGTSKKISYGALASEAGRHGASLMASGTYKSKYVKLDERGLGFPYEEYAYGACVCRVLIDTETGQMKVERIVSAVDAGHAYNRMLVEGQIEGGAIMNMGFAVMENLYPGYPHKHYQINNLNEYSVPTTMDAPDVESIIVEVPSRTGPLGAKGPGEVTAAMIAPGIANAVGDAIGVHPTKCPVISEYIFELVHRGKN
jgi:CO/xanthine dehydrogenase Mo-binding subunit